MSIRRDTVGHLSRSLSLFACFSLEITAGERMPRRGAPGAALSLASSAVIRAAFRVRYGTVLPRSVRTTNCVEARNEPPRGLLLEKWRLSDGALEKSYVELTTSGASFGIATRRQIKTCCSRDGCRLITRPGRNKGRLSTAINALIVGRAEEKQVNVVNHTGELEYGALSCRPGERTAIPGHCPSGRWIQRASGARPDRPAAIDDASRKSGVSKRRPCVLQKNACPQQPLLL